MQPPKRLYVVLSLLWMLLLTAPGTAQEASFWEKLLRFAGISITPNLQKGFRDIWLVNLSLRTRQRLTWEGGFHSPIFAPKDEAVLALRGERLTRIAVSGVEPEELFSVENVIKLVGISRDNPDTILILIEKESAPLPVVGTLSIMSGRVTDIPYDRQSSKDLRMLDHLMGWERVYDGTTIFVRDGIDPADIPYGLETNVFLKQGDADAVNLSGCKGLPCGQPALSHDGRTLVFIKYRE
jgi:hypothetical protein